MHTTAPDGGQPLHLVVRPVEQVHDGPRHVEEVAQPPEHRLRDRGGCRLGNDREIDLMQHGEPFAGRLDVGHRVGQLHMGALNRLDGGVQGAVHLRHLVMTRDRDAVAEIPSGHPVKAPNRLCERPGDTPRDHRARHAQENDESRNGRDHLPRLPAKVRGLGLDIGENIDAGDDLINQIGGRPILSPYHRIGGSRVEPMASDELRERRLVRSAHGGVGIQEAGEQLLRLRIAQGALELLPARADRLRPLVEGRAVLLEVHRIVAAEQHAVPFLDLLLEVDLHHPRLLMLAHLGVERLEVVMHVPELPDEHHGRGGKGDAAKGDDAVQALRDPKPPHRCPLTGTSSCDHAGTRWRRPRALPARAVPQRLAGLNS